MYTTTICSTITAPLHWCIKSPNTLWYSIQQLSISKHLKGRSKLGVRLLESNFRFLGPTFQLAALRTGFAQNTCLTLPFNNRPIDSSILIFKSSSSRPIWTPASVPLGQDRMTQFPPPQSMPILPFHPYHHHLIHANSSFLSLSSSLNFLLLAEMVRWTCYTSNWYNLYRYHITTVISFYLKNVKIVDCVQLPNSLRVVV